MSSHSPPGDTPAVPRSGGRQEGARGEAVTFRTILVTGAHGFAGGFVCPELLRRFPSATLVRGASSEAELAAGRAVDAGPRVRDVVLDILEPAMAQAVVERERPDAVVHLAGHSRVADSWAHVRATWEVNVLGTLNLLEALRASGHQCRFVYIGSGDIYGHVEPEELPLRESRPPRPTNPYAASKFAAEIAALQHGLSTPSLDVVLLRPFAHTGPGQTTDFVCPTLARQVALIEAGHLAPMVNVGNLDSRRDLLDVRDVARAYALALEHAPADTPLNICSGQSQRIRDILFKMLDLAEITIQVRLDPERMRPVDTPEIRGDASAFNAATGWAPEIDFDRTLADLLDSWRERVRAGSVVT